MRFSPSWAVRRERSVDRLVIKKANVATARQSAAATASAPTDLAAAGRTAKTALSTEGRSVNPKRRQDTGYSARDPRPENKACSNQQYQRT